MEIPKFTSKHADGETKKLKNAEPLESVGVFCSAIGVIIHVCSSVDPIMCK